MIISDEILTIAAANSIGFFGEYCDEDIGAPAIYSERCGFESGNQYFSPLSDNDAAMFLWSRITAKIDVDQGIHEVVCKSDNWARFSVPFGNDVQAAIRRAITLCAAIDWIRGRDERS